MSAANRSRGYDAYLLKPVPRLFSRLLTECKTVHQVRGLFHDFNIPAPAPVSRMPPVVEREYEPEEADELKRA